MGNLSSCCLPNDKRSEDERTHILSNPTEAPINDDLYSRSDHLKDGSGYGSIANGSKQEQNAWNRTLSKMVDKVIDVSQLDGCSSIEQSECLERQRIYSQRINQSKNPLLLKYKQKTVKSEYSESKKVNVEPINSQDIELIKEFTEKSYNAFKTGFVVNVNEELIVQFNP